jgi:hypothetical protein
LTAVHQQGKALKAPREVPEAAELGSHHARHVDTMIPNFLLNKLVDDLVIIVMELLRSNQELEMRVASLSQDSGTSLGSLRQRIIRRFQLMGLGGDQMGNFSTAQWPMRNAEEL